MENLPRFALKLLNVTGAREISALNQLHIECIYYSLAETKLLHHMGDNDILKYSNTVISTHTHTHIITSTANIVQTHIAYEFELDEPI